MDRRGFGRGIQLAGATLLLSLLAVAAAQAAPTARAVLVKDVNRGASSNPGKVIDVGGTMFLAADDGVHGAELGKSDGSDAFTLVKDIRPGAGSSSPSELTNVGGILFFSADDGTHRVELWKTKPRIPGPKPTFAE